MVEKRIGGGIATVLRDRYIKLWNRCTQPELKHSIIPITQLKNYIVKIKKNNLEEIYNQTDVITAKEEDFLLYCDFNSLYPSGMVEELPNCQLIRCEEYEKAWNTRIQLK